MDIRVPNLGDGVDSAVVISILVKSGESVSKDQTLLELETDKAVAPLPCPQEGTIEAITVSEGDTLSTGMVIGRLSGGDSSENVPEVQESVPNTPVAPVQAAPIVSPQTIQVAAVQPGQVVNPNPVTSPSLTKLAYRIGLDLTRIQGTGSGGRITEQDVINHVAYLQSLTQQPAVSSVTGADTVKKAQVLPDFSKWGDISVEKCSSLRKKIADKMQETWQTVPHVTQNLDIDITDLMALRKKYNPKYQKKGVKLTLTVFAIRAVQKALEQFPQFNSSYDAEKNEVILKHYFHMGIAVDTENGLIVPVIKNVNTKSLLELCQDLNTVAEKARERTLGMDDLQGSTFTISNLGGLGVGAFTPIVNSPEVAILGVSSGELKPVVSKDEKVTYRLKMPVCLSYDHRVIDGADGARFIMEVKKQFETFSESELKEI
ncbi:hypothetical protein DID78_02660 [Candidatus Marinamargulisbacteria bacterium SCGC AG-343-D04]|nr:hypothetical protein DID78_02660 [Candidatus Marinamargulisbacteria bacterium SCGC AG-343-D04]